MRWGVEERNEGGYGNISLYICVKFSRTAKQLSWWTVNVCKTNKSSFAGSESALPCFHSDQYSKVSTLMHLERRTKYHSHFEIQLQRKTILLLVHVTHSDKKDVCRRH